MNNIIHQPIRRPFDITELERDVQDVVQNRAPVQDQPAPAPAPAPDVGRLTSGAVLQLHESGAKALAHLGDQLKEMLKENDEMVADAHSMLKEIEEMIAHCLDAGKRRALHVQNNANMIKEVRETCAVLRGKIEAGE